MNTAFFLLSYSLLMSLGQLLFKKASLAVFSGSSGATVKNILFFKLVSNPSFAAACVIYALATVMWTFALSKINLSYGYPVVIALSMLLTVGVGIFEFSEQVTVPAFAGIVLIVIGVSLLAVSSSN